MIFVDVDDTLVLYLADQPVHPYGVLMGMGFLVNHALVDRILAHRRPGEVVTVWSGGGKVYAEAVVRQHIHRLDSVVFLLKDETTITLISPGDVVIDDDADMRALALAAGAIPRTPHEEWA